MPLYHYTATDESGRHYRGVLTAANEAELQFRLKNEGQYLKTAVLGERKAGGKLKPAQLADFSRELGSLVGAGIPLARALTILCEQETIRPREREIISALYRSVCLGNPLSQAMEEQGFFPPLMIHMFRAAEVSGDLVKTALQLAEHYQKESKLRTQIKSASFYPKILLLLLVAAVVVIMVAVMPQFEGLLSQMQELPVATKLLFAVSELLTQKWYILLPVLGLLIYGLRLLFSIGRVRLWLDKVKLRLPVAGSLLKSICTARFARSISSLYACGLPILDALRISGETVGNRYIESQFDGLIAAVRGGCPLSEGLQSVDGFTKKLAATVRVGEESGRLEELLIGIADAFDYDASTGVNKLVSLIEPVMIVAMALIVAGIMFAVILPIYDSMSAIH